MEFKLFERKFKLDGEYLYSFYKKGNNKEEKWYIVKLSNDKDGYKRFGFRLEGKTKNIKFHRVVFYANNQDWDIYDSSTDNSIDHIDRDPTNNNIENLRIVSHQENCFNQRAKGCCFDKARGKYQAQIKLNYKTINIGYYNTEQEGHQAYLNKKKELHIIKARANR